MMHRLTPAEIPAFTDACRFERVFGSRNLVALQVCGLQDPNTRFFLETDREEPVAALCAADGILTISAAPRAEVRSVAELVRAEAIREIDTNLAQCRALQELLGGEMESSYYMVYRGEESSASFPHIAPGKLQEVYSVLRQSHPYYEAHLQYAPWSADLSRRIEAGVSEVYQLELDGQVVATGSIASEDEACGVIAAVAVIPKRRHQGLGTQMSRFLVQRILEKGKTPRLISGYDEVAALYQSIGFVPCGRWGELYLPAELTPTGREAS